jgi:hypothetical protein
MMSMNEEQKNFELAKNSVYDIFKKQMQGQESVMQNIWLNRMISSVSKPEDVDGTVRDYLEAKAKELAPVLSEDENFVVSSFLSTITPARPSSPSTTNGTVLSYLTKIIQVLREPDEIEMENIKHLEEFFLDSDSLTFCASIANKERPEEDLKDSEMEMNVIKQKISLIAAKMSKIGTEIDKLDEVIKKESFNVEKFKTKFKQDKSLISKVNLSTSSRNLKTLIQKRDMMEVDNKDLARAMGDLREEMMAMKKTEDSHVENLSIASKLLVSILNGYDKATVMKLIEDPRVLETPEEEIEKRIMEAVKKKEDIFVELIKESEEKAATLSESLETSNGKVLMFIQSFSNIKQDEDLDEKDKIEKIEKAMEEHLGNVVDEALVDQ